MIVEAVATLA